MEFTVDIKLFIIMSWCGNSQSPRRFSPLQLHGPPKPPTVEPRLWGPRQPPGFWYPPLYAAWVSSHHASHSCSLHWKSSVRVPSSIVAITCQRRKPTGVRSSLSSHQPWNEFEVWLLLKHAFTDIKLKIKTQGKDRCQDPTHK